MRAWQRLRVASCTVVAGAGLLASGCGGSQSGSGSATAPPAQAQGAPAVASDPHTLQKLGEVLHEAAKPVPHRKDFKVPASRAAAKTGLDLVNVVTDPMIDPLGDLEDSRRLRERLNREQYVTWILFCLAVDIDDGGLAEMYYNSSGAFAAEAPALLRTARAPQHARIVEQANRLFAPDGRIPVDERARRAMSDGVDDSRFAALDARLMQLEDLDDVNARYIAAHPGAFFSAG
jgi:Domain of unknown function (DUF4375)